MEEEVSLREMPEHFFWYVTADDFDEEGNLTKSETWEDGKLVKSLNKRKL